VIVDLPISLNL